MKFETNYKFSIWILILLSVVIIGASLWHQVPKKIIPHIDTYIYYYHASYPVNDVSVVEKDITIPLEGVFMKLPNVKNVKAYSYASDSRFLIYFEDGTDNKNNIRQIKKAVASYQELPREAKNATIVNFLQDYNTFLTTIYLVKNQESNANYEELYTRYVLPELNAIEGIKVSTPFSSNSKINISLPHSALAKSNIDPVNLLENLREFTASKTELPPAEILSLLKTFKVSSGNDLAAIATLNNTSSNKLRTTIKNGVEALEIVINKDGSKQGFSVISELSIVVERINGKLAPMGYSIELPYTKYHFLSETLNELTLSMVLGVILALGALLALTRSLMLVLNVCLAAIISMAVCGVVIYLAGMSINILTIAALAFVIGTLVDAPILLWYSDNGRKSVTRALVISTSTTLIVIAPLFILNNSTILFVREMGTIIAVMTISSALYALYLAPRIFHIHESEARYAKASNNLNDKVIRISKRLVSVPQSLTYGLLVVIFSCGVLFFPKIEQAPQSGFTQFLYNISIVSEESLDIEQMKKKLFNELRLSNSSIRKNTSDVFLLSAHSGGLSLEIITQNTSQEAFVKAELKQYLESLWGVPINTGFTQSDILYDAFDLKDYSVALSSDNENALKIESQIFRKELEAVFPTSIISDFPRPYKKVTKTELNINSERLSIYGLSITDIQKAFDKRSFNRFIMKEKLANGQHIDISYRVEPDYDNIKKMLIRTNDGLIELSDVASIELRDVSTESARNNGLPSSYFDLYQDKEKLSAAIVYERIAEIESQMKASSYLKNVHLEYQRALGEYQESKPYLYIYLLSASALLVLMLWIYSKNILTGLMLIVSLVPSAIVGLASLRIAQAFADLQFDIVGLFGFVLSLGVLVNNSIIFFEAYKSHIQKGVTEALALAFMTRFKALLLTNITTILAILPLLIFSGKAVELYLPLSIVLVGAFILGSVANLILLSLMLTKSSSFRTGGDRY